MIHQSAVLRLAAATLVAACAAATAATPGAFERIQARGSVLIAHRDASIPMSYVADGKPVGYSIDLCQKLVEAIAQHLKMPNLRVEYVPVTSATRFEVLEKGQADMECGSTTNTAERRQRVAFTIPHFVASSRLIVLSAKPYERIEDLAGLKVASTQGTTNIKSLAQQATMKGITLQIEASRDHAEGLAWVLSGRVEAFTMDDVLLFGLRANAPRPQDLKVIGKPITIEPYAVAFERDNPAFKKVIDTEMRRLIASKELHRLYDKWFTQPIPPKGINLEMRMPHLLADSLRYPTDFVPN